MNNLKIEIQMSDLLDESGQEITTHVWIDDEMVSSYIEPFAFFEDLMNKGVNPYWSDRHKGRDYYFNIQESTFYPFTCSCGVSGCVGIWNGIMSKHRRSTVEWRTKKKDGYDFIPSYLCFDKQQYTSEIVKAWKQLESLFDEQIIDYGGAKTVKEYYQNYWVWDDVCQFMKSCTK